ncbi:MAG: hypothetical protein AAF485_30975 [Chloroflexota bacterium]
MQELQNLLSSFLDTPIYVRIGILVLASLSLTKMYKFIIAIFSSFTFGVLWGLAGAVLGGFYYGMMGLISAISVYEAMPIFWGSPMLDNLWEAIRYGLLASTAGVVVLFAIIGGFSAGAGLKLVYSPHLDTDITGKTVFREWNVVHSDWFASFSGFLAGAFDIIFGSIYVILVYLPIPVFCIYLVHDAHVLEIENYSYLGVFLYSGLAGIVVFGIAGVLVGMFSSLLNKTDDNLAAAIFSFAILSSLLFLNESSGDWLIHAVIVLILLVPSILIINGLFWLGEKLNKHNLSNSST